MSELKDLDPENLMQLKYNSWKYSEEEFNSIACLAWIKTINKYIENKISDRTLTKESVHCYLRHLPIRGYCTAQEEVFCISDMCVDELYKYSKKMNYIPEKYSMKDFLNHHGYN